MTTPHCTPAEEDERNALRDERALTAAKLIVETRGLSALTREAIAKAAKLSPAGVSNFGRTRISNGDHDSEGYRARILRALMDQAIAEGNLRMVRIGLADGCLRVDALPAALAELAGAV